MSVMRRGELAGVVCLLFLISYFPVAYVFGVGESVIGDIAGLIIYLVICATYFLLLFAVKEVAKIIGDTMFVLRMRDFFVASVISCLFMSPLMTPIFVPDGLEQILGLVAVVFIAILGIVSIRVAPFFDKLEGNRSGHGKKAAKWLKLSGWLMATILLSFVGILLSLIADYYMWRLVKQERIGIEGK